MNLLARHFLAEESIRKLDQAARAIGEFRVPADRAAMREVLQHRQALLDDRMRFAALDVRDEPDAASVMLARRVIEALGDRPQQSV